MKVRISLALASFLLSNMVPVGSYASVVKTGASCSKINSSIIQNGYKFTCIKSGKKLIWNKGVKLPSSSASTQQDPTSKTFTIPIAPTSFEDLQSHLSGAIYNSWKKTADLISANQSKLGKVNVLVGPNTKPTNSNPLTALNAASKIYVNFAQPKNVYLIEFEKTDIDWANQEYRKYQDQTWRPDFNTVVPNICPDDRCRNGMSQINNSGDGIILIGESRNYSAAQQSGPDAIHFNGGLESHEYTGTILMLNATVGRFGLIPPWLQQGLVQWTGNVVAGAGSYDDYLKIRTNDTSELYASPASFTSEWIATFLNPKPTFVENADNWGYWRSYPAWRIYDIGQMAVETLVALKGSDAVMNIYKLVGQGQSFLEAFKNSFGIPWEEANPIIASAIAKELRDGIKN